MTYYNAKLNLGSDSKGDLLMTTRNVIFAVLGASVTLLAGCASTTHIGHAHRQAGFYSDPSAFHGSKRAFPERIDPPGKRLFIFSPKLLAWGAYSPEGSLVGYGRASGGANWCKDTKRPCRTPAGNFAIRSEGEYDCESGKYPLPNGGAHMPYCMFFLPNYAIHGAPPEQVPDYNASHGCIRVTTVAAKWLRDHFIEIGTKVKVTSY